LPFADDELLVLAISQPMKEMILMGWNSLVFGVRSVGMALTLSLASQIAYAQTTETVPARGRDDQRRVVLAGERIKWFSDARQTAKSRTAAEKAGEVLGAPVTDLMTDEEPASATLARVEEIKRAGGKAVVVFTGQADQKSGNTEEELMRTLSELANELSASGITVFLVPSATSVGAAVSAQIRMAANDTNVFYVDPGNETSGEPYRQTLSEVRRLAAQHADAPRQVRTLVPIAAPSDGSTAVKAGPAETPVQIQMVPPPPLKAFEPRRPSERKATGTKRPAVAR
jgi:hypothetical protein